MAVDLGLDLAGTTGYAIHYDTGQWKSGLWTLTRGELGGNRSPIPAMRLFKRLNRLSFAHDVRLVVFEETFARGNAKFRLDSLQTVTLLWAMLNRMRWMRVAPSVIKRHATGIHSASKQQVWLEATHRWKDLEIWSYDQSDALWALDYALQGDGDGTTEDRELSSSP